MDDKARRLFEQAEEGKMLYLNNVISRDHSKLKIMPFINYYNEVATRNAKKHGVKPKLLNFSSFIR